MANLEAIIQSEDAAMRRLAELSVVPPQIVFPRERFIAYTDQYLSLLMSATAGHARLHPEYATTTLTRNAADPLAEFNHLTPVNAYQGWHDEQLDQPQTFKQLLFKPPVGEGYPLEVRVSRGETSGYAYRGMYTGVFRGNPLSVVGMSKPGLYPRDDGGIEVREGAYNYCMPYNGREGMLRFGFSIDSEAEKPIPFRSVIAEQIPDEREAEAYRQYGHEGLFAMRLWRMSGWLCAKAGIAPPDMT